MKSRNHPSLFCLATLLAAWWVAAAISAAAAETARRDLGDSLQKVTGSGLRKPGSDESSSSQ